MTNNSAMLLQALNTVVRILGLAHFAHPRVQKAIALGCDPALLIFSMSEYSASFIQDLRNAFALSTSLQIRIETGDFSTQRVSVETTWASGGGSAGIALAQLTHHMEIVQKAAQAEMILNEVVRNLSPRGKGVEALQAALKEVSEAAEAEVTKARALTATPSEG